MYRSLEQFVANVLHPQRMASPPRTRGCVLAIDAKEMTS
jgi:hypothetical protein